MSRASLIAGLAIIAAVVAGIAVIGPRSRSDFVEIVGRGPASLEKAVNGPGAPLFHPQAGRRYTYAFDRRIVIAGFGPSDAVVAYRGELDFDIIKISSAGIEAIARERLLTGPVSGQTIPASVRFNLSADGKRVELFSKQSLARTTANGSQERLNILKDLLSQWAFLTDIDTVGSYESVLRSGSGKQGAVLIQKNKTRYVRGVTPVLPEIVKSSHEIVWDERQGLPRRLRGQELTKVGANGGISSDGSYRLEFVRSVAVPMATKVEEFEAPESLLLDVSRDKWNGHPDYAAVSWESVRHGLLDLDSLKPAGQLKVFGDLVKILKAKPEKLGSVLDLLHEYDEIKNGARSALFRAVVGALASVGTPEAQAAVIGVYRDPSCPVSGKGTILAALTTTQALATTETRDFLLDAMRTEVNHDLALGAGFALGSALQQAAASGVAADLAGADDVSRRQALQAVRDAWAIQQASSSVSTGDRLALLDVMGNSGRSEFLPDLKSVLASEADPIVRAKAVFALRAIATEDARELLVKSLADPAVQIREAAAAAIAQGSWNEVFRSAVSACASSDSVTRVQAACQRILDE